MEGVIEEEIYLGEIRKYKIRISQTQVLSVKVKMGVESERFKRRSKVKVGWKWSDCRVVN
jgi:ABC-type Fe3+/spermidine/putrescine transport system ATPase subunit